MTGTRADPRIRPRDGTAPPLGVKALGVIAATAVLLPILAIVLNVPWGEAHQLLLEPSSLIALRLSLVTSAVASLLALLLAFPLALLLTRTRLPGRSVLRALVLVPLVLPPVVGGLALLMTFGRRGILAPLLEALDVRVAFTTTAVVLAQVFVSMPFTVLTLETALVSGGRRPEQIAASLGASPLTVLRRITLPRLMPAILTGTILAFARSLGEFGATLTFAGSLEGRTRTLPLQIYLERETDSGTAALLSMLLVVTAVVIVLLAYSGRQDDEPERSRRRGVRG